MALQFVDRFGIGPFENELLYIYYGEGGGGVGEGCERKGVNKRESSFQATGLMGTRPFNSGSSDEAGSRPKWRRALISRS